MSQPRRGGGFRQVATAQAQLGRLNAPRADFLEGPSRSKKKGNSLN
ncbi:MAG: hypothetical protein GF308_04165 [Candidatus Heimdallarchaeota archaeon]|nr:hypothetical protein [Candidatus Heimdallarchaeota archaeon]